MNMTHEPLVQFHDVQLGYGQQVVLENVRLDIYRGDFFGLVGPNGSGKTTLLRCLLGILKPLRGQVTRAEGVRIGYVPQREMLDPLFPLTALDIVLMGRYPHVGIFRSPRRADRELAIHCLEQVGLADFAQKLYRELSGGQRQRVLIARALAVQPNLLVLDEPTNGLDLPTEAAILGFIERLHQHDGLTIVLVQPCVERGGSLRLAYGSAAGWSTAGRRRGTADAGTGAGGSIRRARVRAAVRPPLPCGGTRGRGGIHRWLIGSKHGGRRWFRMLSVWASFWRWLQAISACMSC